jgi:hypothetical protein
MSKQANPAKPAGIVAQVHALFDQLADGDLLPRNFMQAAGEAAGFNPATVRTQAQRWLERRRAEVHGSDQQAA